MASTSSFAFSSNTTYDVFLSFRGIETRHNFTSHLHAALCRKNITTFIDDILERGEGISPALMKAIEESKNSVVIFSENYASSRWCLDELVKIIDCEKKLGRKVLPIFYRVNPSDVRKQTGKFGEAFGKVKENSKHSLDGVEKWRTALMEAGNLSGWVSSDSRPESQLCEEVADSILKKLYPISFTASTSLVGIDLHVDKIKSLLCIDPTNVRVIGIWGMGGIGKTTIAEVLVSRMYNQFDCFCFLRNVREKSEKYGLVDLRKSFFGTLGNEIRNIEMLSVVPTFIKDSLNRKKVLAVLDDVNDPEQLEALAINDDDCFGLGSRIILVSRDKQVLSSAKKINEVKVYEVKGLDCSDALQLLSMKAFQQKHPPAEYIEFSERVQTYCKGVPLALKVLGSHLYKRTPEFWESLLNNLKTNPQCEIQNVLEISYNDLGPMEKRIFLDIACFLKGNDRTWIEDVLKDGDFTAHSGIELLVDKCLVTIMNYKLEMHDLIVKMGQNIASRKGIILCNSNDIYHMLNSTNNEANKVVEGLLLDISTIGRLDLNDSFFSRMPNLRLLKFSEEFCLNFGSIFESNLADQLLKCLPNLKSLDLTCSKHLKIAPDFSMMINMEEIIFDGCGSLIEIPSSIRCLKRLRSLELYQCKKLRSLPQMPRGLKYLYLNILEWKSGLRHLSNFLTIFCFCPNLIMSPQIMESLEVLPLSNNGIVELDLRGCKMLNSLPNSTWKLRCPNTLNLSGCSNLEKLPPLYGLCSLKKLYLDGTALVEIPPDIVSLSSLELLSLSDTPMEELPSSIGCLSSLVSLNLQRCKKLKSLPNSICELKCLETLHLSGCSNLEKLPPLYGLCSLRDLYLDGTALVKIPLDIFSLSSLEVLFLNDTPIEELPSSISYELICNCVNARGTIMADAIQGIKARSYPRFLVVLPGSKIPEWLSGEGPGYLIETSFPPGCFNNMFLGFVFCAILEFKAPVVHVRDLRLRCRSSFQNNNGYRVAKFTSEFFCFENTIESDHVFFWYNGRDISSLDWLKQNCDMENKAVFLLKPQYKTQWEVKRFGFHLLYDKVELNKCNPYICREANFLEQLEETANANNKRSREDFYSSNINGNQEVETHPKRLRPNFFMEDYFSNAQDGINYDATMVPSSSSCEFAPKFYKFL
ncbi:disease resistance protein RPV1 [Hevea brasiliensis]|nr:disease resistance protein RPV1 [Hevea brasiliensis]